MTDLHFPRLTRVTAAAACMIVLSSCALLPGKTANEVAQEQSAQRQLLSAKESFDAAKTMLPAKQFAEFRALIGPGLAADPVNGQLNLLNALSYHLEGGESNLALARVGYRLASTQQADLQTSGRASYLLGLLELERQQPALATMHLTRAMTDNPLNFEYQRVLARSALLAGDPATSMALALDLQRSQQLDPYTWRTGVYSSVGLDEQFKKVSLDFLDQSGNQRAFVDQTMQRRDQLAQLSAFDNSFDTPLPSKAEFENGAKQMGVEVTLILSDDRKTKATGVNLLDGLFLQYSADRQVNYSTDGTFSQKQTQITRSVRIPEITYNLNLFNRGNRWYEVVARPSITAIEGTTSKFFVGEQIIVQSSGVNTATIEQLDIGVGLQLTPVLIRDNGAVLNIKAERSFFSDQAAGSFVQQLPTFKQRVEATADVKFGESLVLSGLAEQVHDGGSSRTPGLGDVPIGNLLFKRSTNLERSRSVIVLITPLTALSVPAPSSNQDTRLALIEFLKRKSLHEPALLDTIDALSRFRPTRNRVSASEIGLSTDEIRGKLDTAVQEVFGQVAFKAGAI